MIIIPTSLRGIFITTEPELVENSYPLTDRLHTGASTTERYANRLEDSLESLQSSLASLGCFLD